MSEALKQSPSDEGRPAAATAGFSAATPFDEIRRDTPNSRAFLYVIDWFLPDSIKAGSSDVQRRARLTVATGFLSGIAVFGTLVAAPEEPDSIQIRISSYLFAAALLGAPVMLKGGVPARWIQHGLISLMFCYSMALTLLTGGADTGGVIVAILIPLLAILSCGARDGLIWGLTAGASLALIAIAVEQGFEAPVHPLQAEVAIWNIWAGIAGIVATLGVATTYEWLQTSTLRSLADAQLRADAAHAARLEIETNFRNKLEQLAEDRTKELLESRERLRHSDRLASIGTLAAGVAHQINNPVGSILLGSQFALTTEPSAKREEVYREALESNVRSAERCGRIVKNLLRFSRIGGTQKTICDLNQSTLEAIATLNEHEGRINLQLHSEALPVRASAIELEQMILNLATNAIQSDQRVGKSIEISTERVEKSAVIHIRDQGRGINEEDRKQIFDPFFTTRTADGGTGLGLSVVHGIVEEHGGSIRVESELGIGTCISISLPLDFDGLPHQME